MLCCAVRTRHLWHILLAVGFIVSITALVHQLILPVVGYFFPVLAPTLYDLAVYGAYPITKFVTTGLRAPALNNIVGGSSCEEGLVLLSPFGDAVADPGPIILDGAGNLVWAMTGLGIAMNVKVQSYHNESHLTFWAGDKKGSSGEGLFYLVNSSYDIVQTLSAIPSPYGLRKGDMHDFVITDAGTALITIYSNIQFDLSDMGRPKNGWLTDSIFQEIDLETGELLLEWRASEHMNPAQSKYLSPFSGYKESAPYDFFHINSVDKDSKGCYLVSSRHYNALYYLSPGGQVIWTLGGQGNEFSDLSGGLATSFRWQHDARWVDEDQEIVSLFDNESAGPIMRGHGQSKGLLIQIDTKAKTARLLSSFGSEYGLLSASQGSMQVLPSQQRAFIGWGSSAAYSEFSLDGTLLCETHLTPAILFWWERVKTYRAIKDYDWIGHPSEAPKVAWLGDQIFVSWNGATEVDEWQLECAQRINENTKWHVVDTIRKSGFEDSFQEPAVGENCIELRVAALDTSGKLLRHSHHIDFSSKMNNAFTAFTFFACVLFGGTFGCVLCLYIGKRNIPRLLDRFTSSRPYKYTNIHDIEMD